jgi:hypothetical protein
MAEPAATSDLIVYRLRALERFECRKVNHVLAVLAVTVARTV